MVYINKLNERIKAGEFDNKMPYPGHETPALKRNEQLKEFRAESDRLLADFKVALYAEFEVTKNPKAEKCFSMAWDLGHSSGYSEVMIYFADLVDLIK